MNHSNNPTVYLAFQVIPRAQNMNNYELVDKAIEIVKLSGVHYQVSAMETTMKGSLNQLLEIVKKAQQACLDHGAIEVITNIKIHNSLLGVGDTFVHTIFNVYFNGVCLNTVLITGANRGLGLEFVKQYNHYGWYVLACCRCLENATELKKIKGENIEMIQLDVNELDSISQLGVHCIGRPIDILINNAGIVGKADDFLTSSHEEILSTFRTNTLGPILITQALINSLELGDRKTIVNISSYYGSIEFYDNTDYMAYQISKTALNSATKNMANSLNKKGIIAVSMDPGWVKTDMGGDAAILKPDESVMGIRNVIDKLSLFDSGKFFRNDGNVLPW